jgi:murein DD-endopeptidase MepM/ murein hydrolase activator NlpD
MSTELEWFWPLPIRQDGTKPSISCGWSTKADMALGKAAREHLGADIMYRRAARGKSVMPHQSPWYEVGPDTPCLAMAAGVVEVAEQVARGGYVLISHGNGLASQVMHLGRVDVQPGQIMAGGQQIGVVGGDLTGYPLFHAHVQIREGFVDVHRSGVRVNPAPYFKKAKYLSGPVEKQ